MRKDGYFVQPTNWVNDRVKTPLEETDAATCLAITDLESVGVHLTGSLQLKSAQPRSAQLL